MVPEEEQPYKVPENWVWVRLGIVTKFIDYRGKTPNKTESGIPLITAKNVRMNKLNEEPREFIAPEDYDSWMTRGIPNVGDILFTTEAPLGNVTQLNIEGKVAFAQRIITIQPRLGSSTYLKFALMSPQMQGEIQQQSTGTTVQGIKASKLKLQPIPFPPINEQKRIAEKVERLLNKINQAKQLIEEAKETFELRRAAILDKAFRGKLTRNWRLQHPNYNSTGWLNEVGINQPNSIDNVPFILPKGWGWVRFSDVSTVMSNLVDPSNYQEYPHIAPDNIEKNSGKLLEYATIGDARVTSPKHLFKEGQILYSKIRPYLSKLVIAPFDGLCSADMYPITTKLDTEYLFWLMLSSYFLEKASTAGSRSVLPKINQKELGAIMLPVCHYEEQLEIVSIIRSMLTKEQEARNLIEQSIIPLESTVSKVLETAFNGKLGTNDPNDESSIALLNNI